MAPTKKEEVHEGPPPKFVPSTRSIFYAVFFGLTFCVTVAELGLVSYELHKYGNTYAHYASMEYKHALGLLLASVLISLLYTIFHPFTGVGIGIFVSFVLAVMFGAGAGVVFETTPFKGTSCKHKPASDYPEIWQPYASECSKIVTIQALAWFLFGCYFFLMVGGLAYKFSIKPRPTPGGFYSV